MSGVEAQVRALEPLDLEGLRQVWRERYGVPPELRSPDLLRRWLAWRIQAEALGGLDAETRRRLSGRSAAAPKMQPGTRLVREWKGEPHEVVVSAQGFTYGGATHRSLSEIAREITGARWNGPRFFGLRSAA